MKFLTIRNGAAWVPAVIDGDQAVVLPERYQDLVAFIEGGEAARSELAAHMRAAGSARVPLDEAVVGSPIIRFRRDVLCCGWNYWDHFYESEGKREGQDVPRPHGPTFFTKSPETVIGPFDDIAFDERVSKKWDYEAEIAIVFGKAGRSIPADCAWDHVFGLTLANDVSQRDLQRRHGGQWLKGKSIDRTMPLGPVIVTPDELDVPNLRIELTLNGQTMQSALVGQMAFPIEELIAELTFGMTVHPGDVLLTGTPSGIGNAREPQVFLKESDEVVVRASGIGELRNRLVKADLAGRSSVAL
ncbi:2-keto-4-pentenoate hydratase/2-oxohepta-3-ene-1,7-dioic acid hydratase (catechol pathway) [Bradyrhizobium erythrophlei]|uniref:2-keto-4-pentenoate hydratase/2-oxohepta-3-ene-1,7-dioic acid hydratase (Catechol pathway) n=2 Tax=Bradyrhizobium erythrophlei TaxID=1437360 RepID=A0A1M7T3V4_9BRAD|nr:2-keto-4-pentenoate hydratase/2-oxohepta-3-ene-1,7-dioic acid hydratase (catechol pathway) [Bradyrhizobium erythrophlei]